MNSTAAYIKQRLSLRDPLAESLDIVARLSEELELKKEVNPEEELEKVKALYPTCTDFEREFPSLCFAIATGVGKTRLMGACIAYLYKQHGLRNFFLLAPNLTIYEKLVDDFNNPGNPKYVFKGIADFVTNKPLVITGDNYDQVRSFFSDDEVRINIFNISKFNRDAATPKSKKEKGLPPRIKRFSEHLGQSYWEYLTNVDDLVILMDEAHRYRADASKKAINELQPVLGLELTATPKDDKDQLFSNVVYEYSLARALEDGKYVKSPAIATRRDFDASNRSADEIDRIKLEDAVNIHRDTQHAIEQYVKESGAHPVKPFILVVCRSIEHAGEVYEYVTSEAFFDGYFRERTLQVDSSTKNDEEIEQQFLDLENPENEIEMVIHVQRLKEGWDVTNLYTIVPLRAANAPVLIEQTIGRGLRLPFGGQRTGVDKVDKLSIVAHENFQKVVDEAQKPDSVYNKMQYIEMDPEEVGAKKEVVTVLPKQPKEFEQEQQRIDEITDEQERRKSQSIYDGKQALFDVLPELNRRHDVKTFDDLSKPEVKKEALEKVRRRIEVGQQDAFAGDVASDLEQNYDTLISAYQKNIIEIPRMVLQRAETSVRFPDFDLNTSDFQYPVLKDEIIRRDLVEHRVDTIEVKEPSYTGSPEELIITLLVDYPEIDFEDCGELLFKLAGQAVKAIKTSLDDTRDLRKVVYDHRRVIAEMMYEQMKDRMEVHHGNYETPEVLPFVRIEPWNLSAVDGYGFKSYTDPVQKTGDIPKYVFGGYQKAAHAQYKFDSKPELDMAFVLEHDDEVEKWMRPAPRQFYIYWDNNTKLYQPDFVAETAEAIYIIETKRRDEMDSQEVKEKAQATLEYCRHASEYNAQHGKKPWKYALTPHDEVSTTASFRRVVVGYEVREEKI